MGRRDHHRSRRYDQDDTGYDRHDDSGAWERRPRSRRRNRHVFAWVVVAGGTLVLGLIVLALLQTTGLLSWLQNAYFTAAGWALPDTWQSGFEAIPGWVHAVVGVGVVAVMAGMASELVEVFD